MRTSFPWPLAGRRTARGATRLRASLLVAPLALAAAAACGGDGGTSSTGSKPAPVIGDVAPDTVMRGSAEATVAITGSGFTQQSALQINGAGHPVQFVSASELRVKLTAAELAAAGIKLITVSTPGGGQSGVDGFVVANPVPRFTKLSMDTVEAGSAGVTVSITGSSFFPETTVFGSRGPLPSSYVSPTEMRAGVSAEELKQTGIAIFYVANPEPGGGTVNTTPLVIVNPVPQITAIAPNSVSTRSTGTVTVTGSRFMPGASVYVGSDPRSTFHPATSTQIVVDLSAFDVAASGTLSFRVRNPGADVFSNTVTLEVRASAPAITSLLETSTTAGQPSYVLAVNGTGFVANSVVMVNGEPRPTNMNDFGTQVQTTLTQADLASPRVLTISVSTPAPGGGVSNAVAFTVAGP